MLYNPLLQGSPVIPSCLWLHAPHVVLQNALRCGRPRKGAVRPVLLRQVARRRERGVIHGLKDAPIQGARLVAAERQVQQHERVGQPLDPDADGAVRQVADARLRRGVIIHVNHAVQVLGHDARHLVQLLKVKHRGTCGSPHPSLLRLGVRGGTLVHPAILYQ